MVADKIRRYARIARIIGILVIVGLVGVVIYQVYDFYDERVGFTPTDAIQQYFQALAQGDYDEVYRLTAKENLTDIYGRPITRGEFVRQLDQLTGEQQLPFALIETTKITDVDGRYYYVVILHSTVGGETRTSRLVLEVQREGDIWVVKYPFAIVL